MHKTEKEAAYQLLLEQARSLFTGEVNALLHLSNSSALLKEALGHTIFVGFYLFDGQDLVLGPFQGGVSCGRIPMDKGICGQAARERRTILVEDVHRVPHHIVCDHRAASEIVVPLIYQNRLIGVLDIDSDRLAAFDELDQGNLEEFVTILLESSNWDFSMFGVK